MKRRNLLLLLGFSLFTALPAPKTANAQSASSTPARNNATVGQLIPWLLNEDQQMRDVPFSELIFETTGKKVLAFDANDSVDQHVAKAISAACDETMKRLNAPNSAIQSVDRINEVSSHFEDSLRQLLNAAPGLRCDFPLTEDGKMQRSGYPDLRIIELESKRVFYLDPKLTPPEDATAVSVRFISSRRRRQIKFATTRCISLSVFSMIRGCSRLAQPRRFAE